MVSCYCQWGGGGELWCFILLLEMWQEEHSSSPRVVGAACPEGQYSACPCWQPVKVRQPSSLHVVVLCHKIPENAWGTEQFSCLPYAAQVSKYSDVQSLCAWWGKGVRKSEAGWSRQQMAIFGACSALLYFRRFLGEKYSRQMFVLVFFEEEKQSTNRGTLEMCKSPVWAVFGCNMQSCGSGCLPSALWGEWVRVWWKWEGISGREAHCMGM